MAKQGYPTAGSRYGGHPGASGYPVSGARYGAHPDATSAFATITAPSTANEGEDPAISATSADPLLSLTLVDVSPVVDVNVQTGVVSPYSTTYPNVTPGSRQVRFFNEANPTEVTSTAFITVAPQVPTLSAPADEASFTVGNTITFTADGTADGWDANTTKVEFYLAGALVCTANSPTAGVWTANYDSTGATPGVNLSVVARRYWVGLAGETGTVDSTVATDIDLVSGVTAADPLTIITSATPYFFLSADLGITIGTGVSAWADQSGNGNNAVQGSGTAQPTLVTADADFGGKNSVSGDGSNDTLTMTWNPPAPGTTPVWFFAVILQRTYTSGEYLMAGGNLILGIAQTPTTPTIKQLNTTAANSNSGAAVGSPVRMEALFNNSTTDYLKLGGTTATGTNAGNSDATSFNLFSRNGSGFGDFKIACVGAWNAKPTAGELTALNTWVTNYYGAGVGV